MADTKISALTDGSTAAATDRLPVARSPFGSGDNRYVTPAYIKDYILGLANTWTAQNTFAAGTITSSAPTTFTQTWNDGGVTFTAIKMNVTNTASAAGSMVMDLQVGGSSVFQVSKDGMISVRGGSYNNPGIRFGYTDADGIYYLSSAYHTLIGGGVYHILKSSGYLAPGSSYGWCAAGQDTADIVLARDAANVLAQRNSTNAQAFRVYNTYTDGSNGEWFGVEWVSNAMKLGTRSNGTGNTQGMQYLGSSHTFIVGSADTPSTGVWQIDSSGHLLAFTDNTYDIGASGATRPRDLHLARQLVMSSGTITDSKPLFDLAQTWNDGTEAFTALKLNVTDTASAAASLLMDLQVGASSKAKITKGGRSTFGSIELDEGYLSCYTTLAAAMARTLTSRTLIVDTSDSPKVILNAQGQIGWTASGAGVDVGISYDTYLSRDAANTLAQRNSTNAQTFRLYYTYTDGSNYARLSFSGSGGTYTFAPQAAGTGGAQGLIVGGGDGWNATVAIRPDAAAGGGWLVSTSGLTAETDNAYDIGGSGSGRPRNLYIAGTATLGGVVNVAAGTATPANGSTSARLLFGTTAGFGIYYGSGAPTVSAAQGSIYLRSDGSSTSTRLYVNTDGGTTWTNVTTAA